MPLGLLVAPECSKHLMICTLKQDSAGQELREEVKVYEEVLAEAQAKKEMAECTAADTAKRVKRPSPPRGVPRKVCLSVGEVTHEYAQEQQGSWHAERGPRRGRCQAA